MQALTTMSTASAALVWFILTLVTASSRLQVTAADVTVDASAAASDLDRRLLQSSASSPTVLLSRLRTAVERIQHLADEVDAVLGLVEADIEKDDILAAAAAGSSGSNPDDMLQQLIQEKRTKTSGASVGISKSGRRYDSFGVAGRFGRSVERQKVLH